MVIGVVETRPVASPSSSLPNWPPSTPSSRSPTLSKSSVGPQPASAPGWSPPPPLPTPCSSPLSLGRPADRRRAPRHPVPVRRNPVVCRRASAPVRPQPAPGRTRPRGPGRQPVANRHQLVLCAAQGRAAQPRPRRPHRLGDRVAPGRLGRAGQRPHRARGIRGGSWSRSTRSPPGATRLSPHGKPPTICPATR